jgi:DNA-binding winged helix-turn-helix (wHTH) protein
MIVMSEEYASSATQTEVEFFKGNYRQIIASTIDSANWRSNLEEINAVIGSLSFTGRMEEASHLFKTTFEEMSRGQKIAARFFLGVGLTRLSKYKQARQLFTLNLKEGRHNLDAREKFFVYQGVSFYCFYSGRFGAAERASVRAYTAAMDDNSLYGKALATDLRGHTLVQRGQVAAGLKLLRQAESFAQTLGSGSLPAVIQIARLNYEAQFAVNPETGIHSLKKAIETLSADDTYSQTNLRLELSRQLILRGRSQEALRLLDEISKAVYESQNRRQEVTLNLRYAEAMLFSGETMRALGLIRGAKRGLDPEVDHSLELQIALTELRLANALEMNEQRSLIEERIRKLCKISGYDIPSDLTLLHGKFSASVLASQGEPLRVVIQNDPERALELIFANGSLIFLYEVLAVSPKSKVLYLDLEPGSITLFESGDVAHHPGLTPLLRKLLSQLRHGKTSKSELVKAIWGYEYEAFRHDSIVYSAITSLRKFLDEKAHWIVTLEDGYCLAEGVQVVSYAPKNAGQEIIERTVPSDETEAFLANLNYRQVQILKLLKIRTFIDAKACREQFEVSEITATRDLSHLMRAGLVVRVGRGRAIRYAKVENVLKDLI